MKKKLTACLLMAILTTSMAVGCGGSKETGSKETGSNNTATKEESKTEETADAAPAAEESKYQTTYGEKQFDNVTIKVELFDRSNAPDGSTIDQNKWTDYVKEQMGKVGINVEFVPVPRWDEVTKMQALVSSGTAPDITVTYTFAYPEDYYNQGGTWDLSPFIDGENQAKNMKAYLGQDVIDLGRNANNELFGIVARRATTAKSNLFLRKDWMDKLGVAAPTTPDELYTVVEKMVKENPDGRTDVVGCSNWNSWNLRAAFSKIAGDSKQTDIASSELVIQDYYDEGMKDFYKYMNKMYNAGLMNPEYYTLDEDGFKSQIVNGQTGFFEYSVNGSVDVMRGSLLKTLQENVPGADVVSIEPLKNINDGQQYSGAYSKAGLMAFCPKTASEEVVEACMTYLDWMCTKEGGFTIYHGFEGEHFDYDANGVPVVKDAQYNATDKDWIRADLFLTGNQGYFDTVDAFNQCTAKEAPGYEDKVVENYTNALIGNLIVDSGYTAPAQTELMADLKLIYDDYTVKVVTESEANFDAIYDEYMQALKDTGIDRIIEERTAYYDAR